MRDDIKRLAERVAEMDIVCNMTHLAARDLCETRDAIAAELRALARTDHVEDKLGMVPEGWGIEQHNAGYMVNPPDGPGCWASGRDDFNVPLADQTLAKLCAAMLATSPAPDHSAGAGEMVSSRHREPCWTCGGKAGESTQRKFMFACAECFRDAQPADADAEGGK